MKSNNYKYNSIMNCHNLSLFKLSFLPLLTYWRVLLKPYFHVLFSRGYLHLSPPIVLDLIATGLLFTVTAITKSFFLNYI